MTKRLDPLDQKLLRLLRLNGRRPNSELAAEVGLSASACLRRIRLLEDQGVIRGYTAIVDSGGPGEGVIAIVRLTLEKQTEEYLRRFESAVREHPEIEECFLMTGDADYVLRVSSPSTAAYEAIHTDILSRLPGVARIHSSFAMRNVLLTRHTDRSRLAKT
ncbi:MAG: Lrp/AsnC family transcriptional regulator [Alphaproteobacteria bacterium]|nr:Lrp/AsnC family transcriptional regulator [Alphaproteobacteria bacterium]MBU1515380.1 Lrp/AsnC family transcriptional regulator [Alphaproteobacteria bacterium]MBU2092985.1 Lrp/AsnC family transcriptional regulator [Alphaproteobacteria bacterium]MBU2150111.1 Lrp/AsnC family transcriptional regulator [Alphaproteobacteria bacterium]MBU2309930.1 Lrp/AsnC family transcriptional regulator [Alphaproteobacteria bacterium]